MDELDIYDSDGIRITPEGHPSSKTADTNISSNLRFKFPGKFDSIPDHELSDLFTEYSFTEEFYVEGDDGFPQFYDEMSK